MKECVDSDEGCERVKYLLPIETGYLNKSVRQSMLPPSSHVQQSSLMALTSLGSGQPSGGVNEILLQFIGGGESGSSAAALLGGGDYSGNDSIENANGTSGGGDQVKRHFNLIKSTKSMSLDELKYKG